MADLKLGDYLDGYRFEAACSCGYKWYVMPAELLKLAPGEEDEDPRQWYLDQAARRLTCGRRCNKGKISLTPLGYRRQHHFSGGMP